MQPSLSARSAGPSRYQSPGRSVRSTPVRAALAVAAFAGVHSLLASDRARAFVRSRCGERWAAGLYRGAYNAIALLSFGLLARFLWRLPDRPLYAVRGPLRVVLVCAQGVTACAVLAGVTQVGWAAFFGVTPVRDLLAGRSISRSPVAQHPLPEGGELRWTGPYRVSRHPLNYLALLGWWLFPVMTVKWAVVGLVSGAYFALGSIHEGRRLRAAYGERYEQYRRRAPHAFVPVGRWWRQRTG